MRGRSQSKMLTGETNMEYAGRFPSPVLVDLLWLLNVAKDDKAEQDKHKR